MRRALSATLPLLLLLLPSPVGAAERGVIRGRVQSGLSDAPAPGIRVTLTGVRSGGAPELRRRAVTDERGRYRFAGLPTGDDLFYALEAAHDGGTFAGGAVTLPDDTERAPVYETVLRVWPTTTDPQAIVLRRDDVFVEVAKGGLGVIESLQVVNLTDRAYIGRTGRGPTLGLALPAGTSSGGVAVLDSSIDIPGLVRTDFGVGLTVAIPPGLNRITYTYSLPPGGSSRDLTRTALYTTADFSVYAAPPLDIRANRLHDDGRVRPPGLDKTYRRWSATEMLRPGEPVQILAVAEAGVEVGRLAAAAAAAVVVLLAAAFAVARKRRGGAGRTPTRDELLAAIARLDAQHEEGALRDAQWAKRRAELKAQLASRKTPEPAP